MGLTGEGAEAKQPSLTLELLGYIFDFLTLSPRKHKQDDYEIIACNTQLPSIIRSRELNKCLQNYVEWFCG